MRIYKSDSLRVRKSFGNFANRGKRERIEQERKGKRSKGRKRGKLEGLK